MQNYTLENNRIFFIKLNIYFPYEPKISLIGIRIVENKKPVLQIFIAPLFLLLKAGNNTNIPQEMNGSTNGGHHAMEYFSATKKQTSGTQDNMNRSPVHCSKYYGKNQTQKATNYMIPFIWHPGKGKQ